jgi:SAM-dependent methyltransferase
MVVVGAAGVLRDGSTGNSIGQAVRNPQETPGFRAGSSLYLAGKLSCRWGRLRLIQLLSKLCRLPRKFRLATWLRPKAGSSNPCVIGLPVNLRRLNTSTEAIGHDVEYAMKIGCEYVERLGRHFDTLDGLRTLELGPGHNLGSSYVLACLGAKASVADRYPTAWQPEYHVSFYRSLSARIRTCWPQAAAAAPSIAGTAGWERYVETRVNVVPEPAESLPGIASGSVDAVLSNAVLEHLADPQLAAHELARVTREGGIGLHQVDFRDHRDFSRPLEYLLLGEAEFESMFAERHGECGRQLRYGELSDLFSHAGFTRSVFDANWLADEVYLDGFIPRLRACPSRYRDMTRDELRVLSGHFTLCKPLSSHP